MMGVRVNRYKVFYYVFPSVLTGVVGCSSSTPFGLLPG